jgi:glycosyltransferase involved in cell wall biosynthesis
MRGDRVEVMVHEPFLAFGEGSLRQNGAAIVHRLMTAIILRAASRVWVSTPAWGEMWRPYAFGRRVRIEWLPVPSTVPFVEDSARTAHVRELYIKQPGGLLIGHFGTYSPHIAEQLKAALPVVLTRDASASVLLLGRGSERLREENLRDQTALGERVSATGALDARELSAHLAACDLVVQPFPDGVTTRRTSVMAALAHRLPVLTTAGRLTEPLWAESRAVALAPACDAAALADAACRLLADDVQRTRLAAAGLALYRERFRIARTIAALRRAPESERAPRAALSPEAKI